jgi:hypothetical protein
MLNGRIPQTKSAVAIELAREKPLVRRGKVHRAREFDLGNFMQVGAIVGVIHEHATNVLDRSNDVPLAVKGLNLLAQLIDDAGQRCVINRVGAFLIGGRKPQGYPTPGDIRDNA